MKLSSPQPRRKAGARPSAAAARAARVCVLLVAAGFGACRPSEAGTPLRISGSTTVHLVAAEAAEHLRDAAGLSIWVDTQGGSSGGIAQLGAGSIEIALSSKPLTAEDRRRHPDVDFVEHKIGEDAVALVVSADVWESGVRSLTKTQVRDLYEGRVRNWNEVGGADQRIAFFNKEPGRGTWEVFARWLYGDPREAPPVQHPQVGGNEETRNKVAGSRGAISQLSYSWADRKAVFPLALEDEGLPVAPTPRTIASGDYPMRRPLLLLTNGPPGGAARRFVDYVLSPQGQALVRRHGYLALDELQP